MNEQMQDDETYTLIGVAMKVHGELGGGFLKSVYTLKKSVKICVNLWQKKGTSGMLMGWREPQINTDFHRLKNMEKGEGF